jgi:hypothetical protein
MNPTGKSAKTCPAPFAKIFGFSETANHLYNPRRPVPLEGRLEIVTDSGQDAVDARGARDEGVFPADGEAVWS